MTRLIIVAVVGLLVGIGGGSGIALSGAKQKFVADSVARAKAEEEKKSETAEEQGAQLAPDDAHPDGVMADPGATAPPGSARPSLPPLTGTTASKPASGNAGTSTATTPPSTPAPSPNAARAPVADSARAGSPLQTGKLARIFAAMPPKEAARVLEQLEDSDVTVILSAVSEKQAAAILANFAPQRAAAISRAAVRGSRDGR